MTTLKKVKTAINGYQRLSAACDAVRKVGALDVNGELWQAILAAQEDMLEIIDPDGWIHWYIYENDCGKRKMKAGYDGKLRVIDTPAKLAKLIEEGEKRK